MVKHKLLKDDSFSHWIFWHLYWKLFHSKYEGLFLFHWSIYLSFCHYHTVLNCSFVIVLNWRSVSTPTIFLFFKIFFVFPGLLHFHMNFRNNLPISAKSVGMEKAIVLNLQISLAVLPFTNIKSSDSWQYVFPFSLLYFKKYFLVFIVQGLYFLLNFTWVFYSYWWCGMELVNGN